MCGRFTLSKPVKVIADLFQLAEPPEILAPRYNIAPGQLIPVIALKPDGVRRGMAMLKWGLVPRWADTPQSGPRPINARADSLGKPTFREAFREQRCLIPADGFYEWRKVGKVKQPVHFRMFDDSAFAFAGMWDVWTDGTHKQVTCCHITTEANDLVGQYHDRMPVILPPEAYEAWLAVDTPEKSLRELLRPYPAELMTAFPVSTRVNTATNEGPECLIPTSYLVPSNSETLN